jgi:hypothetical protein
LSTSQIDKIVERLKQRPVVGPDGRLFPLDELPCGISMAAYPLRTVLGCEGVLAAANSREILDIAGGYLRCTPTISSIGIRWSFPKSGQLDVTQQYHRDVDDWRFIKLFIYLSDVDDDSGPHQYVKGSHRRQSRLRATPYTVKDIDQSYGVDKIETVTGPRGTTFVADTFGIHCGVPPREKPRLILQVQYSVLPIYAFLYDPLKMDCPSPMDDYTNRLLIKR